MKKRVHFPKDEGAHKNITEWWYFNGHLTSADNHDYSFMIAFFKVNIRRSKLPKYITKFFPFKTAYVVHTQITDKKNKIFR